MEKSYNFVAKIIYKEREKKHEKISSAIDGKHIAGRLQHEGKTPTLLAKGRMGNDAGGSSWGVTPISILPTKERGCDSTKATA